MIAGAVICARCNNVIEGGDVAFIGNETFCHDKFSSAPTCYMRESWERNPDGDTTH